MIPLDLIKNTNDLVFNTTGNVGFVPRSILTSVKRCEGVSSEVTPTHKSFH